MWREAQGTDQTSRVRAEQPEYDIVRDFPENVDSFSEVCFPPLYRAYCKMILFPDKQMPVT